MRALCSGKDCDLGLTDVYLELDRAEVGHEQPRVEPLAHGVQAAHGGRHAHDLWPGA